METNNECEIEPQMSKMLKFKYYRHHLMSRKFTKNHTSQNLRYYYCICKIAEILISRCNHKYLKSAETCDILPLPQILFHYRYPMFWLGGQEELLKGYKPNKISIS